ncbi:MAG: pyrroline-5-carboxylate reductase [Gammaproteobacteria bacterium]|jgi:pyrroline-5-carboxylate reductase
MEEQILFVGGGNMGRAIIGGLLGTGYPADKITVADPDQAARDRLSAEFAINVCVSANPNDGVDVVVLAVKPQIMAAVATAFAADNPGLRPLYVSIAAGITTQQLSVWLGADSAIVRVMPNTPAMVGAGAAAMFANEHVDAAGRAVAAAILEAVGIAVWVPEESQLDAVTALSGSGPAYFFLIFEILERIGSELGLDPALARQLAIETGHGAALLARTATDGPGALREQVTSPGGTTEAALRVLGERDITAVFREALRAAHARAVELARDSAAS